MKTFSLGLILGVVVGVVVGIFASRLFFKKSQIADELKSVCEVSAVTPGASPTTVTSENSKEGDKPKIDQSASKTTVTDEKILTVRVMALIDKAKSFDREEQSEQALKAFANALELAPNSRDALKSYGHFLSQKKMWPEAIPTIKKCLKLYPAESSCHDDWTNYLIENGNPGEQLAAITTCLKAVPDDQVCINNLGVYYRRQKQPVKAIKVYEKLLTMNTTNGIRFLDDHIHWQLAGAYEESGQLTQAIAHYAESCKLGNREACDKASQLQ